VKRADIQEAIRDGEHVLTPSPVGIHIRNGRVERELTGHRCAWNDAVLRKQRE